MHFIESQVMIKTMQTHNTNVKVKFNHLLWRSRSRDQDYQFINSPESPSIDGWFPVFNEVFSNCEPGRDPKNIIGKLVVPGDDLQSEFFQFIASYFIDDKYLDSSGRPIKQYLIWFHQDYEISEINELFLELRGCGGITERPCAYHCVPCSGFVRGAMHYKLAFRFSTCCERPCALKIICGTKHAHRRSTCFF